MKKYTISISLLVCCIISQGTGEAMVSQKIPKLKKYHAKRDFTITPEPKGNATGIKPTGIFVIQKHASRRLHYDFRLEVRGVLASWAVPKGLPKRAGIRRLAVQTEDHPLEYATFAGRIPSGQYGAGLVEIFDHGTYENIRMHRGKQVSMEKSIQQGIVEVCLNGQELAGCYVLVRTNFERSKNDWLLMKKKNIRTRLRGK